jgi:hypothetical protein
MSRNTHFNPRRRVFSTHPNTTFEYSSLPGNKDVKADDLHFQEYAGYVHRALFDHGFVQAEAIEKANIAIFLSYGIGDPQEHQFSFSMPTFGQTGISSAQSFGTFGSGLFSGTTTYTPSYGVTGSQKVSGRYITYFRFMLVNAVDLDEFKESGKEIHLWKTTVTSSGASDDLRQVFPVMVAASKDHIATNTGKRIKIQIQENDDKVLEIKGLKNEKVQQ